ncbi:hypothetical protein [Neobacillus sp. 19]|uniref:hypothetical protein n=1 Tax=Neobacillus sp. 19 TaxID=3394458 RepID=UPI003BF72DB2
MYNLDMISVIREAVQKRLEEDGCVKAETLFKYVIIPKSKNFQTLDYRDMVRIMLMFIGEGWVVANVSSLQALDWEWCKK